MINSTLILTYWCNFFFV